MPTSDETLPLLTTEEIEGGAAPVEALQHAEEKADRKKLEGKAITGTIWTVGAYGVSQSLRMVNNVVLTHMLAPEYFGIMSLAFTLLLGVRLLSDIGLLPAVINSPRGDEPIFPQHRLDHRHRPRRRCCGSSSCCSAFPRCPFITTTGSTASWPPSASAAFSTRCGSSNTMTAARHIGVRRLLTIDLVQQIFAILVTIVWALIWPSVWALVIGTLSASVFRVVVTHIPAVMPGIRNRLAWEKEAVHSLINFGKWILVGTAFYALASQADRLILGKLISFTELGVYGMAFTFADIPRQIIQQFCYRVGLPFIAKMTHLPRHEFRAQCLRYRFYVLCAGAVIPQHRHQRRWSHPAARLRQALRRRGLDRPHPRSWPLAYAALLHDRRHAHGARQCSLQCGRYRVLCDHHVHRYPARLHVSRRT